MPNTKINAQQMASMMAQQGRYGDTMMAHVAPGEMVVPREVLANNPQLASGIMSAVAQETGDPSRYMVGSPSGSYNPVTGKQEFFNIGKAVGRALTVNKKDAQRLQKLAPLAALAVPMLLGPMSPLLAGAVTGGITSLMAGGRGVKLKDVLEGSAKGAAIAGIGSGIQNKMQGKEFFSGEPIPDATGAAGADAAAAGADAAAAGAELQAADAAAAGADAAAAGADAAAAAPPASSGQVDAPGSGNISRTSAVMQDPPGNLVGRTVGKGLTNYGKNLAEGDLSAIYTGAVGLAALGDFLDVDQDGVDDNTGMTYDEYIADYQSRLYRPTGIGMLDPFSPEYAAYQEEARMRMGYEVGGEVTGPGTGTSDSIPAMLSDGEFVMTAAAVRGAGGGDRNKGAARMYQMMDKFEKAS